MRIVLAPDKFKSTLDAPAVARALKEGVSRAARGADCIECPLADGGEGSIAVLLQHAGGNLHVIEVTGPNGRPVKASFAALTDGRAAVEMAAASGMSLVTVPDPLGASSRGTGELMNAAAAISDDILVFVGGSASTDGGTGAARAVGWDFLDRAGVSLPEGGGSLRDLAELLPGSTPTARVIGACDVTNPLTGPMGSARTFAPQKGAGARDVIVLEQGLERLADVVLAARGTDIASIPYGGAGGGMGAGLVAFFGAQLTGGFDLLAMTAGLDEALAGADLIITGEGRLDETSFAGKVVSGVLAHARKRGVPCAAVVGSSDVPPEVAAERGLAAVIALDAGVAEDMQARVARAVERLLREGTGW